MELLMHFVTPLEGVYFALGGLVGVAAGWILGHRSGHECEARRRRHWQQSGRRGAA